MPKDTSSTPPVERPVSPVSPTVNTRGESTDAVNAAKTKKIQASIDPGVEVPAQPEIDGLLDGMKANVQVYICAKTLCVDTVRQVAQKRAMAFVKSIFTQAASITGFAPVLDLIYTSTTSGTDLLREQVTGFCLDNYQKCANNAAVAAVIDEHEPMIWKVAIPKLRSVDHDRDARMNSILGMCNQEVSCPDCSFRSRLSTASFRYPEFGSTSNNVSEVKIRCKACIDKSAEFDLGKSTTSSLFAPLTNGLAFGSPTSFGSAAARLPQTPSSQGGSLARASAHVRARAGGTPRVSSFGGDRGTS
jgi:hypothetical protein